MPYLIDGNNLLGAARDRRLDLPRAEDDLIRALASFSGGKRAGLTVVFDGPAGPRRGAGHASRIGRVKVLYSGTGRSADDAIIAEIERHRNSKDFTLVSSDNKLRSHARHLGCRVMGCSEFAAVLSRAKAATSGHDAEQKPLPGDIEEWERYFSGEKR